VLVVGTVWLGSGSGWECADGVQDGEEVGLRWPVGGEAWCPSAAGVCQSAGDGEQVASAGGGGLDRPVGEADRCCPACEVVRERGDHGPGAVGVVLAGGEVRERLVFEVADRELDVRVVAVVEVSDEGRGRAVGEKAVLAPVGPQLGLCAERTSTANDQPKAIRAGSRRAAPRRCPDSP
jgi:hypothetical protein